MIYEYYIWTFFYIIDLKYWWWNITVFWSSKITVVNMANLSKYHQSTPAKEKKPKYLSHAVSLIMQSAICIHLNRAEIIGNRPCLTNCFNYSQCANCPRRWFKNMSLNIYFKITLIKTITTWVQISQHTPYQVQSLQIHAKGRTVR